MGKLQELQQLVAEMFKDAESKEQIEQSATLNNKINEVAQEQNELVNQNAELVNSYKELVKHTSFNDIKTKPTTTAESLDFEEELARFMENNKN